MGPLPIQFQNEASMPGSTLLLALTGWMDGGLVSTGTVRHLMRDRDLIAVARIDPVGFYVENLPGDMETAALYRPKVRFENGLVAEFESVENQVTADPPAGLAFFLGKEPHISWRSFSDCLFEACRRIGVGRIVFIGSFGGSIPHTREPRLYGSVSHRRLQPVLRKYGIRPSQYEGPASFATLLLSDCPSHEIDMFSISAEIPGYLSGLNPMCIAAVTRRLAILLNAPADLNLLREASTAWEEQVTRAVEKDKQLARTVRKLEEDYDNELIRAPEEA